MTLDHNKENTARKGCIHVYTGTGKGKTTAAVGLAVRAAGAGFRVMFIQFVKGGSPSHELLPLEEIGVRTLRTATQPTGLLRGGATPPDFLAATDAFNAASRAIQSGEFDLVVLDEFNVAMHHKLVEIKTAIEMLAQRAPHTEVVCTGRNAPQELMEIAHLVTEMNEVKHPFRAGIPAREGIEF